MIPRSVANYSLRDLIAATLAGVREDGHQALRALLERSTGARQAILVPSARAGLMLLLRAINRPRVICPAYTCSAVIEAIRMAGKVVDLVPIAQTGFNTHVDAVAELAGPDAVILMTHQFGQLADVDAYKRIANQTGAILVEDAAAAQGGSWNGSPVGSHGIASLISFESAKILHAPLHAGVILCSDEELSSSVDALAKASFGRTSWVTGLQHWLAALAYAMLRNRGLYSLFHFVNFRLPKRYSAEVPLREEAGGSHYTDPMQSWQAHLLCRQFASLDTNTSRRREISDRYRSALEGCTVARFTDPIGQGDACARFAFVPDSDRPSLIKAAWRQGIDLGVAFSCIEAPEEFADEQFTAASIVNLPLYPQLTEEEIRRILDFLETSLVKVGV